MRKISILFIIGTLFLGLVSCGGGGNKVKVSDTGEKLMAHAWKLQTQETLDDATNNLEEGTGIEADIKLEGDVAKIVDFLAETLTFARDKNPEKLFYERKIGEGILSTSVVGFWEMSEDDKFVIFKEWDGVNGVEKKPVRYEIKEITDSKLVLLREGDATPNIYAAK